MKFSHAVEHAAWNEDESRWHLHIHDTVSGVIKNDCCDVLITAIGGLNAWKWPDIPGLRSFKGDLIHSADWNDKWKPKVYGVLGLRLRRV